MSTPMQDEKATETPNQATTTRPERSSKRVARKAPLAWLPLALLGALALLALLTLLAINAIDDDGPDGPAGDSLGQVGGSGGSGINGADGQGGNGQGSGQGNGQGTAPQQGGAPQGGAPEGGLPQGDLAALTGASLVGGAGVAPAAASAEAGTLAKRDAGTVGTVLFAEGSAEVDANGTKVVDQAVQTLRSSGARQVVVAGYTDVVAGQAVNEPLSERRASAVAASLKQALPELSVTTEARGQQAPVASNENDEGRQQNRRAAILAR